MGTKAHQAKNFRLYNRDYKLAKTVNVHFEGFHVSGVKTEHSERFTFTVNYGLVFIENSPR